MEVKVNHLYLCLLKWMHMFDLMSIMNKVKEAQAKVKEAQARLVHLKAEGEAGAGMVKVWVNGNRKVISIQMDDSIINISDKEMLGDLVVAATNKAMEQIEGKIKEEMKSATDGMMPNIPGMDFGSMF
jgi:nucleoid-associated protein EbfC